MQSKFKLSNLQDTLQRRMEEEADLMVSLERKSRSEIIARHSFICVLVLLGSYIFSLIFPLVWFILYISTSLTSRYVLRTLTQNRRLRGYVLAITAFGLRLFIFRTMIVYLWFFPEPAGHYIGFFMVVASVRFSVNLKSRVRSYMILHSVMDILVLAIITADFVFLTRTFDGSLLVGLTSLLLIFYYIITLVQNHAYLKEVELLEAQTRQAQKMEAVGRLTGGVAHDFNNILTVVMGNLELHDMLDDPKEKDQILTQTRDAARRAADLTSQLLAFSRQSHLTQMLHDVEDIFSNVETLSKRLIPANIVFSHRVAPYTSRIRVDATQLEVALLNLVINARDAMEAGGKLVLKAQNAKVANPETPNKEDEFVAIRLTDEGGGIPDELIDKVTEPFFTTKEVGKGSGLGLSMVKGFAEQSGGFMQIRTVAGVSTTIALFLPAASGDADQAPAES